MSVVRRNNDIIRYSKEIYSDEAIVEGKAWGKSQGCLDHGHSPFGYLASGREAVVAVGVEALPQTQWDNVTSIRKNANYPNHAPL